MKQLPVSFLTDADKNTPLNKLSDLLDKIRPINNITVSPWNNYEHKPEVSFVIGYGPDAIFLKYYVTEKETKARYSVPNDPVYKDSCVEFFIAFEENGNYYNMEFNCLGNALIEFGPGRSGRTLLPASVIEKIQSQTVIRSGNGMKHWELTLTIPFDVFYFHILTSLKGLTCPANFHKCGDDLKEPHYLVWNDSTSDVPDFHLPVHFGKVIFR
jgi:hypothetical protein